MKAHTETILAVAALLTAIVTIASKGKTILDGVKKMYAWMRDQIGFHGKVLRQLEAQGKAIEVIKAEMQPNGGSSIKDAINEVRRLALLSDIRSHVVREWCPFGSYECTPDGRCIWANEALCTLFGLHPEEMIGYGWLAAIAEEERQQARETWDMAVKTDTPYSDTYTIVNGRTGARVRCRAKASAFRIEGNVVLYSGTVTEIKDQGGAMR